MYALAPEFDWVADVIMNRRRFASMAARMSPTRTSRPTNPSSCANPFRIPKTTGDVMIDFECFTRRCVSPIGTTS